MLWEQITISFGLGAVASTGICLVSCTPILIGYLVSTEKDPRKFIGWFLLFIAVRAVMFVAITLIILLTGRLALDFIREYAKVLHIIGGAFIAAAGVLIFLNLGGKLCFFRAKSHGLISLALLFGIKPCLPHLAIWGYVLTAVGAPLVEGVIAPSKAVLQSASIAIAFSIGENIVPIIIGVLGGKSIRYFRGRGFQIATKVGGVVLFILGIGFIFYETVAPAIARMFA